MKLSTLALAVSFGMLSGAAHAAATTAPAPATATAGMTDDQVTELTAQAVGGDAAALDQLKKAADQGNPTAAYDLGLLYYSGQGVSKDIKQAVDLFRKAADKGNTTAETIVGQAYLSGEGVPHDDAQAAAWLLKAAEQGDADAQFGLGTMYSEGTGVPKDYKQAFAWLEKSANQGNAEAANNLAKLYMDGDGTTAAEWLQKAAQDGDSTAAVNLCGIYGAGKGISRDLTLALQWCIIGDNTSESGSEARVEAQKKESILVPHLGADEIAKAKAGAGAWIAQFKSKKQPDGQ
jgi:TPR repeat protein